MEEDQGRMVLALLVTVAAGAIVTGVGLVLFVWLWG